MKLVWRETGRAAPPVAAGAGAGGGCLVFHDDALVAIPHLPTVPPKAATRDCHQAIAVQRAAPAQLRLVRLVRRPSQMFGVFNAHLLATFSAVEQQCQCSGRGAFLKRWLRVLHC